MKKILIYQLLLFPLVFFLWYLCYPEHLGATEAYNFFAWLPDYFTLRPFEAGILSEILSDYLSQFYRWREAGACIQAIIFLLVLFASDYLLTILRMEKFYWIAFIPAGILLLLQLNQETSLVPSLQYLFFIAFLTLYTAIGNRAIRIICFFALLPLFIALFPVMTVLILYTTLIIFDCLRNLTRKYTKENNNKIGTGTKTGWILSCFILLITVYLFISDRKANQHEMQYAVENAAFVSDWNQILALISPDVAVHDSLLLRYTLLALSEKELLTDHLFKLPPQPADCFYFYQASEPSAHYFNSLFYAGLGLYNESVHQISEAITTTPNGMNFRCLRSLIDWYLKMGNVRLAEKYLTILSRSTCHRGWIKKRQVLLSQLRKQPIPTPDRSNKDIFIGAYEFIPEMGRLVEEDPGNKKKTDYLLCALLLNGDHKRFKEIFERSLYQNHTVPLPKRFQEQMSGFNR